MDISQFVEKQSDEQPALKEVTKDEPKPEPEKAPEQPTPSGFQVTPRPEAPEQGPNVEEITNNILSSITDIGSKTYLKMMVIGEPGSGKSSFLGSADNALVQDFEQGLIAAKFSPYGVGSGTKAIPYTNFNEFVQTIKLVRDRHEALERFEIYAIDTLSDLSKRNLSELTERDWKKSPSTVNRYVPTTDHYVESNEKILRVLRSLRDIDRHVIIAAHSKTVEPKNRPSKTYADFSESLANKISGMMDIVGYMESRVIDKKPTKVMRVVGDGSIMAKTRIPLPEEILNPTLPDIIKAWEHATKDE